jgi:hypothetical protein
MGRGKTDSFTGAFGIGFGVVDAVASIMLDCRAHIPFLNAVWGPSSALGWFFVEDDFGARWCKWGLIKIDGTVHLGICGELGIETGFSEQVESDFGLRDQSFPKVERE